MSSQVHARGPWPPLGYIWAAALGVLALHYLLRFLFDVRAVLVVLFFGVLFGLVLTYPLELMSRLMPRWAAALLVLLLIFAFDAAVVYLGLPFLERQLQWLGANLPLALERLQTWWERVGGSGDEPRLFGRSLQQRIGSELGYLLQKAVPVAFSALSALSGCLVVLALALFFAYDPESYKRGLARLLPGDRERSANELLHRLGSMLQRWMSGTLISMTITGVLTALGLASIGIESWLVLGTLSFVLEFVPYLGPLLSALPGIALGFAISPIMALWVAGVYAAVQLVESYLVQPLIMKQAIQIQPAVLLVWQLAMGSAFGLLGLFTATPLLACIQVVVLFFREHDDDDAESRASENNEQAS